MTHVHVQALMKKIKHMWDDPMMVQSPRDVVFPCSWSVHMYIHVPPTGHLYT